MQPKSIRFMPEPLRTGGNTIRRLIDVIFSLAALVTLAPLFAIIALCILTEDGRPILFLQERIGRGGRPFRIFKFRSMANKKKGTLITVAGDRRVTGVGSVLRKLKLDETAQFFNVLRGDMSLCGPRPEIPYYVDLHDPLWRLVLRERPGITDPASLVYRHEEEVLAAAADPEKCYRETVLPEKLQISLRYLQSRSLWTDLKLICMTARSSFGPTRFDRHWIERALIPGGM